MVTSRCRVTGAVLDDEDAFEVAAFLVSQSRPRKRDLDKDYPNWLQKSIDAPYGPHCDGFSAEQHKLGLLKILADPQRYLTNAN